MSKLASFFASECGAVTVDWVVLTASMVGLGLATVGVVSLGVEDASGDVEATLSQSNGKPIIRTAFTSLASFLLDGESLADVVAYGEAGSTLEASDVFGSVTGDNAYVITSSTENINGVMAGGLYLDTPDTPLEPGETYRVSYWARAETGTVTIDSFAYGYDGDDNFGYDGLSANNTTVGEEWTYVEFDYSPQNTNERYFFATNDLGVTYALDDLKLEKVN